MNTKRLLDIVQAGEIVIEYNSVENAMVNSQIEARGSEEHPPALTFAQEFQTLCASHGIDSAVLTASFGFKCENCDKVHADAQHFSIQPHTDTAAQMMEFHSDYLEGVWTHRMDHARTVQQQYRRDVLAPLMADAIRYWNENFDFEDEEVQRYFELQAQYTITEHLSNEEAGFIQAFSAQEDFARAIKQFQAYKAVPSNPLEAAGVYDIKIG